MVGGSGWLLPPAAFETSCTDRDRRGRDGRSCCGPPMRFRPAVHREFVRTAGETKRAALAAQPQGLDHLVISLHVLIAQVAELTPPLTHELQQPASRGVVVLVLTEMFRQVHDPIGE